MPGRRWRIALLLAAGVLVSFFDRINLSVSRDALHASFGLSVIAFGYVSSAFSWSYAAAQMPVGVLLDRWGVRRVGRISAFLWSIASFAAALSPGLAWLFGARLLLGVSEASTFPANAKALGYWFTHEERSLATAITDSAAKFANAVGLPFIGLLLVYFGWRWSFAVTGFISALYFVLFYFVYRNPGEDKELSDREREFLLAGGTQPEDQGAARRGSSLGYLLRQRKVHGLALGWTAYNYTFYLLLVWLPTYFSMSVHLDPLHSALYSGGPWLFATATDLVVGGWLVEALIRRGCDASRVRQAIMIGGMVLGLAIVGAAYTQSPGAALVWISVALGGLAAAAPVAWTVPSLISPRESVGSLAGVVNLCGQMGAITASIVTGYLVTSSHSFATAFVTAGIILLLGIVGYIVLLERIEPIPDPREL